MAVDDGFSLIDQWQYEFNGYFDGIEELDFEDHDNNDMLEQIANAQLMIDYPGSSRLNKTFSKALNLRYLMWMAGNLHQPFHNIIR